MAQKCKPEDVINYRRKHKCFSGAKVGRKFGISRERTRQILKKAGVDTKASNWGDKRKVTCPECGGKKNEGSILCESCRTTRHRDAYIDVACTECETLFKILASKVIRMINKYDQQAFLCSNPCKTAWVSRNYGFPKGVYQGNHQPRKWDWEGVLGLYKTHSATEVEKLSGVPASTVYRIAKDSHFNKTRYLREHTA